MRRMWWRNERGMSAFGLIEILIGSLLIIWLAMTQIQNYTGAGQDLQTQAPPGKAATPTQRAESVECRSNLSQVRQAVTMYQSSNERLPASIQDLSAQGVTGSILSCPVGGAQYAYTYDPRTGRVQCRYPGHEQY